MDLASLIFNFLEHVNQVAGVDPPRSVGLSSTSKTSTSLCQDDKAESQAAC